MSSAPSIEPPALRESLSRRLNAGIAQLERIGGGRNSQVFRVETDNARTFALKVYFRHPGDQRDRLAVEYKSFSYLWANAFREIPQPVAFDSDGGWALYQFVEGQRLGPGEAGAPEVAAAAEFLSRLRVLSGKPASSQLGVASEAFFALSDLVEHVHQRLARLDNPEGTGETLAALRQFLVQEFRPLLARVGQWSQARIEAAGQSFSQVLPATERTLSPSDFGFHNVLRQADGRIIFLDFEYFGWDDPAKMIADFLLHPAMELSPTLRRQFAATLFRRFSDWPALRARVECVYPLFGLKWCVILLNEFQPVSLQRRRFAATAIADRSALQMQQLGKARQMLGRIAQEFESFPYHD